MRRQYQPIAPIWFRPFDGKLPLVPWGGPIERGKLHELGAAGWGCTLVHREVVLKEFTDETELPRRLEVHYPDIGRKFEAAVQHYQRQVTDSKLIKKIQTPILMDADQAKQLSHVAFRYFWTGKALHLVPGAEI